MPQGAGVRIGYLAVVAGFSSLAGEMQLTTPRQERVPPLPSVLLLVTDTHQVFGVYFPVWGLFGEEEETVRLMKLLSTPPLIALAPAGQRTPTNLPDPSSVAIALVVIRD